MKKFLLIVIGCALSQAALFAAYVCDGLKCNGNTAYASKDMGEVRTGKSASSGAAGTASAGKNSMSPSAALSKQGYGFFETAGAVMDPALSDPYASRTVKDAAYKRLMDSYKNIQEKRSTVDAALRRSSEPLKLPKCGLVSAADIGSYPLADRYLTLNDPEISHYFILQEDYVFEGLDGSRNVIPAGFVWDGASIPKDFRIELPIVDYEMKLPNVLLDVGNTRYNSALGEGLIHDWMYRNPTKYSKEDADLLFYVNAVRCKNADPLKLYEAVNVAGSDAYNGHLDNVKKGLYDDFTDEFYDRNREIYQSCLQSRKPKVFERDQECKSQDQPEDQVCRNDKPVSMDDLKNMDLDDENGDWCKCDPPGCINTVKIEEGKHVGFIAFECRFCKKVNVKFAKEALEFEQVIKSEGGTPQWFGPNSEQKAKSAAGNAK